MQTGAIKSDMKMSENFVNNFSSPLVYNLK